MPPRYVKTIREEILYEYAKLISRSVFGGQLNRGFITDRFKALRDGEITMSGTNREWQREQEMPKQCVFCGAPNELQTDHLIPRSRGGKDQADNMVWSCLPTTEHHSHLLGPQLVDELRQHFYPHKGGVHITRWKSRPPIGRWSNMEDRLTRCLTV